jgi:hypothetical protein
MLILAEQQKLASVNDIKHEKGCNAQQDHLPSFSSNSKQKPDQVGSALTSVHTGQVAGKSI